LLPDWITKFETHNCAKFRQFCQSYADILWLFIFCSRWRPSAMLDLFGAYWDHSQSTRWSLSLCKIWLWLMQ